MKQSKEKLNMGSGIAVAVIIASLLLAGSLLFIAAQPGEDSDDFEGPLGASVYVLDIGDLTGDDFERAGAAITIKNLYGTQAMGEINDAGSVSFVGMSGGDYVVGIWEGAFKGCTGMISIELGEELSYFGGPDIMDLGCSVFDGCTSLESITVDSGNMKFKAVDGVLFDIDGETLIAYPAAKVLDEDLITGLLTYDLSGNTIKQIASYAFDGSAIEQIILPSGLIDIGSGAFNDSASLVTLEIPNSVTSISNCFSGCSSLESVTIGSGIISIPDELFSGLASLKTVVLGANVQTIGNNAFSGCASLETLDIPNSVKTIGNGAFHDCSGLTSIVIGNSVETIGSDAFVGCTGLKSITVSGSNTYFRGIDGVLFDITGKTLLKYPAARAFSIDPVSGLRTYDLSEVRTIEHIASYAFDESPIQQIILPAAGSMLSSKGIGPSISFGVNALGSGHVVLDYANATGFNGWFGYNDDTDSWIAANIFYVAKYDGSVTKAFTLTALWDEGFVVVFKNGNPIESLSGSVSPVSIMMVVGKSFTLSSAYEQACLNAGEAKDYFQADNRDRLIYWWTCDQTDCSVCTAAGSKGHAYDASFIMTSDNYVAEVTFTVADPNGWSKLPVGDSDGKGATIFGLDATFFWLLILLIIILLAILAAYLVSKKRRQQEED